MIIDKDHDPAFRSSQLTDGGKTHSSERNSGIELLKIFAILLVILSHVAQTLGEKNALVECQDYVLNLSIATTNLQQFVLVILRYSGALGNAIFFVCSAWFLLDSKKVNKKRWWFVLLEIWSISVTILAVTYILRSGNIEVKMVVKSLFPTTFGTNWYMTCYLLFYLLHPILNEIIGRMSQSVLLEATSLLLVLYIGFNFIKDGFFFTSAIIIWVAIYFAVAYIKIYLKDFASNVMVNICLLLIALAGHIGLILITNLLGLQIRAFSDKLLHWNSSSNPFLIVAAICLLNLARKVDWRNYVVNLLSKQSMLIYIIHENLILRRYYRPYLINYIYENFGYQHIVFWVLALTLAIFLASACASLLYEHTLQRLVKPASERICENFDMLYQKYENLILKLR